MKTYIRPTSVVVELTAEGPLLTGSDENVGVYDRQADDDAQFSQKKSMWNSTLWDEQ